MGLELRDPWLLQMLFDYVPGADLLALAQAAEFVDGAVTEWLGVKGEPAVLGEPGLRGLCSEPRHVGAAWRIFFWRCLRALSAEARRLGRGAPLSGSRSVEQWFKLGDEIADDMLVPDGGLYGQDLGAIFGHTVFFYLFTFDPAEVRDVFGNPGNLDNLSSCTSDSVHVELPAFGVVSLQLELFVVDDAVVFKLQILSVPPANEESEIIETPSEVIAISPVSAHWGLLDKYRYSDPNNDDRGDHFWFNRNRGMYAEVARALQDGLPLPLMVSMARPRLPEVGVFKNCVWCDV